MHKIKIQIVDDKYVGYAMINEQIVFTTAPQLDVNSASRLVTQYIQGNNNTSQPVAASAPSVSPIPSTPTYGNTVVTPTPPPPRKCCGRG